MATFQLQRSGRLCFVESGLVAVRCENPAEMHLVRKIRSGKTESRPPHQEGCEGKKVLQPTQDIQISAGSSEVMRETRLVDGDSMCWNVSHLSAKAQNSNLISHGFPECAEPFVCLFAG